MTLNNCRAPNGGGICVNTNFSIQIQFIIEDILIKGCQAFSNKSHFGFGGGIFLAGNGDYDFNSIGLDFRGMKIYNNSATNGGQSLYIVMTKLQEWCQYGYKGEYVKGNYSDSTSNENELQGIQLSFNTFYSLSIDKIMHQQQYLERYWNKSNLPWWAIFLIVFVSLALVAIILCCCGCCSSCAKGCSDCCSSCTDGCSDCCSSCTEGCSNCCINCARLCSDKKIYRPSSYINKQNYPPPQSVKAINIVDGYHQTSREAARQIIQTGFRPGTGGIAGGGIYFALNVEDTNRKAHQKGVILKCQVDIGRTKIMKQMEPQLTGEQLKKQGYDSVYFPANYMNTNLNLPEYVIYDSNRVKKIEYA
ncbi:MAG: hypothetical protein EZS28_001560 [Streblomastix strix]|uniref:PARP catalytic domain-containing protein n=1 Tax=Streblomastix strix TaxID=222440 RepID=A0A5J4X8P9_9EUKA|nr:MAG: hypothetical protein EZS28_001560 [Streblomastix strix]